MTALQAGRQINRCSIIDKEKQFFFILQRIRIGYAAHRPPKYFFSPGATQPIVGVYFAAL